MTASRQQIIGQAAGIWLASRVALLVATYFAQLLPRSTGIPIQGRFVINNEPIQWETLFTWWPRFANIWHLWHSPANFPVPALLGRIALLLTGHSHTLIADVLMSNVVLLGGCVLLALLAEHELGSADSLRGVIVLVTWPLAILLATSVPSAVMLTTVTGAMLALRTAHWKTAAAFMLLAAGTGVTALVLIVPALTTFGSALSHREPGQHARIVDGLLLLAAVPAGWLLDVKLGRLFGAPNPGMLLTDFRAVTSAPGGSVNQLLALLPLVLIGCAAVVLVLLIREHVPGAYVQLLAGALVLAVLAPIGTVDGGWYDARSLLLALPAFIWLGRWGRSRPWLDMLVMGGGVVIQAALVMVLTGVQSR